MAPLSRAGAATMDAGDGVVLETGGGDAPVRSGSIRHRAEVGDGGETGGRCAVKSNETVTGALAAAGRAK